MVEGINRNNFIQHKCLGGLNSIIPIDIDRFITFMFSYVLFLYIII